VCTPWTVSSTYGSGSTNPAFASKSVCKVSIILLSSTKKEEKLQRFSLWICFHSISLFQIDFIELCLFVRLFVLFFQIKYISCSWERRKMGLATICLSGLKVSILIVLFVFGCLFGIVLFFGLSHETNLNSNTI
jgi:hypothetical protein